MSFSFALFIQNLRFKLGGDVWRDPGPAIKKIPAIDQRYWRRERDPEVMGRLLAESAA